MSLGVRGLCLIASHIESKDDVTTPVRLTHLRGLNGGIGILSIDQSIHKSRRRRSGRRPDNRSGSDPGETL